MAFVLGADFDKITTTFATGKPFGEDPKNDSTFFDLRAEVQKLTAMSSKEGSVDWKSIKKWAIEVLSTKAKDLNSAAYLALGLFVVDGYPGLADGLAVLHHHLTVFWDGMYPPVARTKPRVMALEWLVTRLTPLVEDRAPAPTDGPALVGLPALVEKIQEAARSKLMHEAPPFSELLAAVTARVPTAAPPQEPAPGEAAGPAAAAVAPAAPTAPGVAPTAPAAVPAAPAVAAAPAVPPATHVAVPQVAVASGVGVGEIKAAGFPVVHAIRQADPMNPTSYRVLRCLRWDDLAGAPPADPTSGKTRVPAPRAEARIALEGLFSAGNWPALLDASEGAFAVPSGTWWLDLQRYTVLALENLDAARGPKVAEVVKGEICRFLDRIGNIASLSFADSSPIASEATRTWLAEIESSSGGGGFVMMSSSGGGGGAADAKVFDPAELEEAKMHFGKKRLAQALDILQRGIERAQGPRAKFRARLIAGRACLEAEQEDWAKTLLEESHREMESFTFERWEQELAVETYQLLAHALARVAKERKDQRETLRAEVEKIKSRLFRLDMRAAAVVDELLRK